MTNESTPKRRAPVTKACLAAFTMLTTIVATTGTASAQVEVTPDGDGIPGAALLGGLVNGLAQYALLASVGAVLVGAGFWGWSNYNDRAAGVNKGQKMIMGGILGAIIVGASGLIINTAFAAGTAG